MKNIKELLFSVVILYASLIGAVFAKSKFIVSPEGDLIFYNKPDTPPNPNETLFSGMIWEDLKHSPYRWHSPNSVRYTQVPSKLEYFVAREVVSPKTENKHWKLVLLELNASTGRFTKIKDLLTRGDTIGDGYIVTSAYDPSLAVYEGEVWVAFECNITHNGTQDRWTVDNQNRGAPYASTCIGLLDTEKWVFDRSRISVPIVGIEKNSASTLYRYSASVPKLFVYNNTPYLYYTVVKQSDSYREEDNKQGFVNLHTRGVRLYKEDIGRERLWATGSDTGMDSISKLSTIVFDAGADNINVADVNDVKVGNDNTIIAVTGVGEGSGCVDGLSRVPNCYYPVFSETQTPLSYNILKNTITNDSLRSEMASYPTFFRNSEGNTSLLVMFIHPDGSPETPFPWGPRIIHNINNDLVLDYDMNVAPIPDYPNAPGMLGREAVLAAGQFIDSPNRHYRLIMQQDGNLVLYRLNAIGQPQTAIWTPYTEGHPGSRFVFQYDSNLVIYAATGRVLWASATDTYGGVRLKVQNAGNLVLFDRFDNPVWVSNTGQ